MRRLELVERNPLHVDVRFDSLARGDVGPPRGVLLHHGHVVHDRADAPRTDDVLNQIDPMLGSLAQCFVTLGARTLGKPQARLRRIVPRFCVDQIVVS